jgi:hypothetical protein
MEEAAIAETLASNSTLTELMAREDIRKFLPLEKLRRKFSFWAA